MLFDWSTEKSERCRRERGFNFAYAALIFESATIEYTDSRHDYGEHRKIAFGFIEHRLFGVVYTDRGDVHWIIAAFPCREKELRRWQRRAAGL